MMIALIPDATDKSCWLRKRGRTMKNIRKKSLRGRGRAVAVFVIEVLLVAAMLFIIVYGSAAVAEGICTVFGW